MRALNTLMVLLLGAAAVAQTTPPPEAASERPSALPAVPRFNVQQLDRELDPCTDFYAYACTKWKAANPIPSDQPAWGQFSALVERNRQIIRAILEKASLQAAKRGTAEQKIGDYYASCMDESAINRAATRPLQPGLERIARLQSKREVTGEIVRLHQDGVNALFSFSSEPDFNDASMQIAVADQGGLGLPDRDYYFKEDPKSVETRQQYVAHVQKMLELLGDKPAHAAAEAKVVMEIETMLAKGSLDRTSRRDPAKVYHKMTRAELAALSPEFSWDQYLEGIGGPPVPSLNVAVPDFFRTMSQALRSAPLENWKTYLRWQLLHSAAPLLPEDLVEENFNFYEKILQGTKELSPRWKRCVRYTTADLGEAVGQKYVDLTFGVEGKQRTLAMVNELEKALQQDITQLPWMTETTKQQALAKLRAISNRIGYPDKWRDYSKLNIVRDEALGNSLRSNQFEFNRQLNKIGKPVDKGDWPYPPATVNASYNPLQNNITFPAGILQPPFYDNNMDDAVNFGGMGAVIGHELTHGFDDQGRKFDAQGNLRDWWTAADAKAFQERANCVADEYSSFTAVDDLKLNGTLTLGENVADNGGLRIAYMALLQALAGKQQGDIDGFTPAQRFFLGWGEIWCVNRSDAFARMLVTVDPHSPGKERVNGVVSNMPEFREAFHCRADAPMVRQNACRVW